MATPAHSHAAPNPRIFKSDYFLPQDYVDQYANKVRSRKEKTVAPIGDADNSDGEDDTDKAPDALQTEGDPTDGQSAQELSDCVKNWKFAVSDNKKKM